MRSYLGLVVLDQHFFSVEFADCLQQAQYIIFRGLGMEVFSCSITLDIASSTSPDGLLNVFQYVLLMLSAQVLSIGI